MAEHETEDLGYPVAIAAAKLGYRPSTVYKMIAKRILGCVRAPGMDARVYQSHIDAFKKRFLCPARGSMTPTTGSSEGMAGASGTSPGPIKVKRSWSARELKLDLKAQNRPRRP